MLFNKIITVIESKIYAFFKSFENPVETLDYQMKNLEEQIKMAKLSKAKIKAHIDMLDKNEEEYKKTFKKMDEVITSGAVTEDIQLKKYIGKKIDAEEKINQVEALKEELNSQYNAISEQIEVFENNLEDKKTKKIQISARYEVSKLSKDIASMNLNADIDYKDIEERIEENNIEAQALNEVSKESLSDKDLSRQAKIELEFNKIKNNK